MENNERLIHIGRIDENYEVVVVAGDEYGIPHFHLIDAKTKGSTFDCALLISDALYIVHNESANRLSRQQKIMLDEFLNAINDDGITHWTAIIRAWNNANSIKVDCYYEREVMSYRYVNPASLRQYKAYVGNNRFVLVEYWCLCRYCEKYCPDYELYGSWKYSLTQLINAIKHIDVENGVNRRRTLVKMLIKDNDYDDPNAIMYIIRECGMESDRFAEIANEFAHNIYDIIDDLVSENKQIKTHQ